MVAARTAARGLSPADLDGIRETLAAGRRPKVVFTETAGQIAGQVGQVVRLDDPASGEEFVTVRFGRDELPFSPTDLALPPRGGARAAAGARRPGEPPGDGGGSGAPSDERGRSAEPSGNGRGASMPRSGLPAGRPARPAGRSGPGTEPAPGPELRLTTPPVPAPREPAPGAAGSAAGGSAAPAPRKAGRVARAKPPAALTVTLAYAGGEWTVAATQGTKSLAKPYVIKPAEALKMVGLLDVPGVHEAVEQIVAAERTAAEEQAQRLRSQLAEVEAKLAELGELS